MEDPRAERAPAAIDRRKLLLGIGFGLTNAAVLRQLAVSEGTGASSAGSTPTTSTSQVPNETADLAAPSGGGPSAAPAVDTTPPAAPDTVFDTVIANGRVMDPETGFDRIANVGITGDQIAFIGEAELDGTTAVDATGKVVSPGFIDILSYQLNGYGEWFKVADGVTSNLGMHGLRFPADDYYNRWVGEGAPVHFGGSVHTDTTRGDLGYGIGEEIPTGSLGQAADAVRAQIEAGYFGIHAQPEYTPGMTNAELTRYGKVAGELGVPLTVHARFSDNHQPGTNLEAVTECIQVASDTGAHVHVEHINSTGGTGVMAEAIDMIEGARAEGLSMTACMYPYTFWATGLQTPRYNDWQEKYDLSYSDLQVAGQPDRLNATTYQQAFEESALTAAYAISEADNETAVAADFVMVGSDAILETSHDNHPRATGCFSRTIAQYVRERRLIGLMEAIAKMTILPAKLIEGAAPAMRRKGRLQVGADADITVFDPNVIADRSTIVDPSPESVGVEHVFVNGTLTRDPNGSVESASAGTAIRSELA